jgi:hypothetical protein
MFALRAHSNEAAAARQTPDRPRGTADTDPHAPYTSRKYDLQVSFGNEWVSARE